MSVTTSYSKSGEGPFLFRSRTGLQYAYDDRTGTILPVETLVDGTDPFERYRPFGNGPRPVALTADDLRTELQSSAGLQLTLLVTDRCSLRCRYCVYSGTYENSRSHGSTDMPLDVALKAIDYLRRLSTVRDRYNPSTRPGISFYGGEPLLNFDLIQKVIEYTERLGFECTFNMTTNGVAVDDSVARFLVAKRVNVAVSFDGPADEHDRKRVFADGRGSHERAFAALRRIRRESQAKGNGHGPYTILTCIDRGTDVGNLDEYFRADPGMFGDVGGRATMIYPYRTSYYDGWSEERLQRAELTSRSLLSAYLDDIASCVPRSRLGFREWLFGSSLRSFTMRRHLDASPFRSACIPGGRTAVDSSGRLHICERVNQSYPIGDIEKGLDLNYLCEIVDSYLHLLDANCAGCNLKRLCGLCYAHVLTDGGTRMQIPQGFCEDTTRLAQSNLGALCTVLEKNPDALLMTDEDRAEVERDRAFVG